MATFLKLLSLNLLCKPYFGLILNLWSQIPPTLPPPGGPGAPWGRGLYFGGKWVVATFLKLLSSNLVCKPPGDHPPSGMVGINLKIIFALKQGIHTKFELNSFKNVGWFHAKCYTFWKSWSPIWLKI